MKPAIKHFQNSGPKEQRADIGSFKTFKIHRPMASQKVFDPKRAPRDSARKTSRFGLMK
jgi:hypothetical protein